jgi:molybdopterin-guanine dinucleotide biosynthesis protein A
LLQGLVGKRSEDVEVICARPGGRPEPLPGLYRRSALPAVDRALERGERALGDLVGSLRRREVPQHLLERWDPGLLSFLNINTPDEIERARALPAENAASPRLAGRRTER